MAQDTTLFTDETFEAPPAEPEGIEGRLLSERIRYLRPARAIRLPRTATVAEAVGLMRSERIGALLVTGEGGALAGIFTERDVLTRIAAGDGAATTTLGEVMTPDPETLHLDDGIAFALNMMHLGGYRHIPVLDERNGDWHVVSVRDVVRWMVELFPDTVLTLPPDPLIREPDKETGG